MTDNGTFSAATLKEMMRRMDALVSHDEIAISMLFPPDKVLGFSDDNGTVWAMGLRLWHQIKVEALRNDPTGNLVSPITHAFGGIPYFMIDNDDPASVRIKSRIARSMKAAVEVEEFLKRLRR